MNDYPPSGRPKPVLMRRDEIIGVKKAAHEAARNEKTIREYAKRYGIGRQTGPNSLLEISIPALNMVLQGDFEALEQLRNGNRSHPDVVRHLNFAGIAI